MAVEQTSFPLADDEISKIVGFRGLASWAFSANLSSAAGNGLASVSGQ